MKHFDDDMDELFNKAGRDYPLKTDASNWDAVRGALYPGEVTAPPEAKNGFRRYLPLLLLLLIPLGVYFFVEREGEPVVVAKEKTTSSLKRDIDHSINKQSSSKNLTAKNQGSKNLAAKNPITKNKISEDKISQTNVSRNNVSDNNVLQNKISQNRISQNRISQDNVSHNISINNISTKDPFPWNKVPPYGAFQKPEINISIKQRSETPQSVPNIKKKKPSNKTGFYYGVAAAPDISRIKDQDVKGTGYSAGLIAGYQLNGHWSVEAGLLWSRKKYFTTGKYFSKEGAHIPPTVDVLWLNGGCNMFEVPLLARYDFSLKKNTFFATAGLISYMMKTEDYTYGAKVNPSMAYYEGERKYNRSGDHLFSNLQLSAGYKFSLSPKMNIRIEPYLKAPLKKIGIGKMPITSAGLLFGITRDFR